MINKKKALVNTVTEFKLYQPLLFGKCYTDTEYATCNKGLQVDRLGNTALKCCFYGVGQFCGHEMELFWSQSHPACVS